MASFARRGEIDPHSTSDVALLRSHGLREILDFRSDRVLALRVLRPTLPPAAETRNSKLIGADIGAESPRRDTN